MWLFIHPCKKGSTQKHIFIILLQFKPCSTAKMSQEISTEETFPDGSFEVGHFNMLKILYRFCM